MRRPIRSQFSAFTLLELVVGLGLTVILSAITYSYFHSGTTLYVRTTSINQSHAAMRQLLDRISDALQTAEDVPILINTTAATVTSGSAAGLRYDRFIAEPYVLSPALTATSISASATTLDIIRSTAPPAPPPRPSVGDILVIDTLTGNARGRISAVGTPVNIGSQQERITLTFSSPIGQVVSWVKGEAKQARLVRHEAFLVMPTANGRREVRFYPVFDPAPNLGDAKKYVLVTNELATNATAATPFSMVDPTKINGERMVQMEMQVRARQYDNWLASKKGGGFNTFTWVKVRLPSRLHARTQDVQ